ncbi:MAG: thiol-activated cytolysin family protein [Bacteroidota bacterium]
MEKIAIKMLFLAVLCVLIIPACNKDNPEDLTSFRKVIDNGGNFEDPMMSEVTEVSEVYTEEVDGVNWECTTETVSIQEGAGGNEGFSLFSPNASVIYPGNMLQGKSLNQGTPDIIAVERAGGTISTDVVDGNIQSSFDVSSVSKGEVTVAVNNIIAGSTGIVPANFSLVVKNIQSREQFALELGLEVNSTFTDLEARLNYSSVSEKNTFIVNLNQSFYTMSFDIPTSLDDLFDPSVTPEDLARYVGPDNPATYISDVTYGRVFYMLVSSTSSVTEMDAAINASFNGVATDVEADVEASYLSELDELTITVFAYGGDANTSLLTVGTTDLEDLVKLLAESSRIESGKPISYVVRSVYDNQIVSTQLATTYDVTNCTPTGADGAPPYTEHWTGNVISAMGPVGAAFNTYGTEFILINRAGDQFMRSNVGSLEGPFPIDELGTEPCPFNSIGAACNIDGNQNGEYYLQVFDGSGTQYSYLNPSSGNWLSVRPISDLALGDNPFGAVGIGAVAFRHKDSYGPASRYMFNKIGDRYVRYDNNPNSFDSPQDLYYWGVNGSVTAHFDGVGAAIGFYIGNLRFYILFNDLGTQYVYSGNLNGNGTEVIGPFDL